MERRLERREVEAGASATLRFIFRGANGDPVATEVINFHHRGAALRLPDGARSGFHPDSLDCYLGDRLLRSDIKYRVAWDRITEDGSIGLEFVAPMPGSINRASRAQSHRRFDPTVTVSDPLDPNRTMFLRVLDLSSTGLLLEASLTNRHMMPGMELRDAQIVIPGGRPITIDLVIENTRRSEETGVFLVGVSVRAEGRELLREAQRYLAAVASSSLDKLAEGGFLGKQVKHALTFRVIRDADDYRKVLELRYLGYKAHGKVVDGAVPEDMGEGLANEGTVIGAFLGGQLVASLEVRFDDGSRPLRTEHLCRGELPQVVKRGRVAELNKMVVSPNLQGSDVVLGVMQKAHGIVASRGSYDVLVAATNKLWPFYERVGFKKTGTVVPHPSLPGEILNILIIHPGTYTSSEGLNPIAWETVYGAGHEHLVALGVVEPIRLTLLQRLQRGLTRLVMRYRRGSKRLPVISATKRSAENGSAEPNVTAQHYAAPVIYPYVIEADKIVGRACVDSILDAQGVDRKFLQEQSNWVGVEFLDKFLDGYAAAGGDVDELSRRAGRAVYSQELLGARYLLVKHFATPDLMFRAIGRIGPRFNRTRTYRTLELRSGYARVGLGLAARGLLPKHRAACSNWEAAFDSYISVTTGRPATIREVSCCYDDADACVYEIRWQAGRRRLLDAATATATGVALVGAWFAPGWAGLAGATALATVLAGLYVSGRARLHRERTEVAAEIDRVVEEAEERYADLQRAKNELDRRYRESRLLEEISKKIQSSTNVSDLLHVSLDAVCTRLGFGRAFIMLRDETGKILRTAAVGGSDSRSEALWSFHVDVSQKRENPVVLSSVFHSGQPVLIDDVEANFFQFNDVSRRLIRELDARGFIIVPVPSSEKGGTWGVLVADKAVGQALGRSDLVLLQRLAQHAGIALDKQAKIDTEAGLRRLFQTYVPSRIEELAGEGSQPKLGGQIRDVVCMFLDIRDFTHHSAQISPHATLELVNRVFEVVHAEVTDTYGVVNKYLGDGVLATWGAVGERRAHPDQAVLAARAILARLPELNAALAKDGLPVVRLGIGLHCGPAVVGNVGVEERMEFTLIGSTINLAARLESLCKELNASLVVSDEVRLAVPTCSDLPWSTVPAVRVKGVERPLRVHFVSVEPDVGKGEKQWIA